MKLHRPLLCAFALLFTLTLTVQAQPGPGRGGKGGGRGDFSSTPQPKDDAEKKILETLEEMDRTQRAGSLSVPREDGRLLRILAESMGAKHVVELGTSIGYSGTWFGLALRQTGGKLTTFEIDPQRAATARANFKKAGVDSLITIVEGDAHEQVTKLKDPVDLVFIDADKEGYADYLKKLLPLLRPGGLVVAHNINASMASPDYIKAITTDPKLDSVFVSIAGSGISLTLKKH